MSYINESMATNYSTTQSNALFDSNGEGTIGSARVGIVSAHSNNIGIVSLTGSYFGITELAGNILEIIINVPTVEGRAFIHIHEDGLLHLLGNANTNNWLIITGAGYKGGVFGWVESQCQISNRTFANTLSNYVSADKTLVRGRS
jgi:hypothetical protein